jgi:chromosomal replication initiation ATPase DnaA
MSEKYELKNGNILKDGHTMFLQDVVMDLQRKSYLEDLMKTPKIERVVCSEFKISIKDLHSKSRKRQIVLSRHVVIWHDIRKKGKTQEDAASRFGQDHATALHARDAIDTLIEIDKDFKVKLKSIVAKMEQTN